MRILFLARCAHSLSLQMPSEGSLNVLSSTYASLRDPTDNKGKQNPYQSSSNPSSGSKSSLPPGPGSSTPTYNSQPSTTPGYQSSANERMPLDKENKKARQALQTDRKLGQALDAWGL